MKTNISGFPEFLPNEQIAFNRIVNTIESHFESHGFVPMETSAVERVETLLSKGNDNEIYGLYRLADENSKKDLGLRFDLTVPLARYVSQNAGELVFPFRRYHIAPVWRGERPQYGRYRQFYQCDIDIIGDGELSLEHDAEIISLIVKIFRNLQIPHFHTQINNKKILSGFFAPLVEPQNLTEAIKLVDKIEKISVEQFETEMLELLIDKKKITAVRNMFEQHSSHLSLDGYLQKLKSVAANEEFSQGVEELAAVIQILKKLKVDDRFIMINPRLARGLTYYTGTIFETTFDDVPGIGSISGGGRYDNLTMTLGNAKKYPGVGATIGISRLIPRLIELGLVDVHKKSTADVLITVQDRSLIASYMFLADKFRALGIKAEVYLQDKPLGAQLTYANKKGIDFVVIANELELLDSKAILRNLATRQQEVIRTEFLSIDLKDIILRK